MQKLFFTDDCCLTSCTPVKRQNRRRHIAFKKTLCIGTLSAYHIQLIVSKMKPLNTIANNKDGWMDG